MISAINKASGELIELSTDNFEEIVAAYKTAQEYAKVSDSLKNQLKKLIPTLLDEQGKSPVSENGLQFRQYETQRSTYDKSVLRDVFDEDTIDLFLDVSKSKVDAYIKEHSDELGDDIKVLKSGLVPNGAVTKTTRLDRVL